ncbi:hypothetical protein ACHAQJ_004254 [Trichoderma viride]
MSYRASIVQDAKTRTDTEKAVQAPLGGLLENSPADFSMKAYIFELGVDSFNLTTLKAMLTKAVVIDIDIPMPTIASILKAIDSLLPKPILYDLTVHLLHGTETPLFFIYAGSADPWPPTSLCPVYAIRARSYSPNELLFNSIQKTADAYALHIRKTKSEGPLDPRAQGQQVKSLASIDYSPHIKHYIRGLDWVDVLLHIAFFLELISEVTMTDITLKLHAIANRIEAQAFNLEIGDEERAVALAIDVSKLELISDIAENFRVSVETYEPVGQVESFHVFRGRPADVCSRRTQRLAGK